MGSVRNVDARLRWKKSWANWGTIDSFYREAVQNYVLDGLHPGSFFRSIFENNLAEAALHSHPANSWQDIVTLMKWLINEAPDECWGSEKKVAAWLKSTPGYRRKCCEKCGLVATEEEMIMDILRNPNLPKQSTEIW